MLPGDPFTLVLFLLLLQNQLNKQLLQLLIAVIDAELLKAERKGKSRFKQTKPKQQSVK